MLYCCTNLNGGKGTQLSKRKGEEEERRASFFPNFSRRLFTTFPLFAFFLPSHPPSTFCIHSSPSNIRHPSFRQDMAVNHTRNSKDDRTVTNTKRTKVLIVGAGLAGLTLALLLQKANISYEVFERAQEIKPLGNSTLTTFEPCFLLDPECLSDIPNVQLEIRFCYCADIADFTIDSTTWTGERIQFFEQDPYCHSCRERGSPDRF